MERYRIIKSIEHKSWNINCPIQADKYNILFDNTLQKNVLQIKFKNVADKQIKSVYMDIVCYDDAKDKLGVIKDISYMGLTCNAKGSFGNNQPVITDYKNIGIIDIIVTKVVFSDDSIWRNENNAVLKLFDMNSNVKEHYGDLYEQYVRECNSVLAKTNYVYEDKGEYWICSCGQPNKKENEHCLSCSIIKENLNKISDKPYLAEKLDEYKKLQEEIKLKKEKEEKEKHEREVAEAKRKEEERVARGKKIKKVSVISLISVVIIVFLCFSINYGLNLYKYLNAVNLSKNGDYVQAVIEFSELNGFKDSEEKHNEVISELQKKAAEFQNKISASGDYTVGLRQDGTVIAVGDNEYKQCNVTKWKDIVAVSAGGGHTIGLKSDGTVVAVGWNKSKQCNVSKWKDIVAISAGGSYTIGLKSDGTVVAVGDNDSGQCDVSDWNDIVAVSVNDFHTVGLKTDDTVVAVGSNYNGQCDVSDWKDIVAISAGDFHTVGLKSDGTIVATGSNKYGQCNISDWEDIVAISAGCLHTIGLKPDGTVVAVGDNEYGQCDVSNWKDIVAISAGFYYTVGLKSDGTVVAVGDNDDGQCNVSDWKGIGVK